MNILIVAKLLRSILFSRLFLFFLFSSAIFTLHPVLLDIALKRVVLRCVALCCVGLGWAGT